MEIGTIPVFIKVCVLGQGGQARFSPRFDYSLEELTGLSIYFYSLLSFTTVKTFTTRKN